MANRDTFNKRLLEAIKQGKDKSSVPARVVKEHGQSESRIQQDCLRWFATQYPQLHQEGMLYHIANEGIRLGGMGARLKRESIVRGVADLCLCVPSGGFAALYVEMKKPGNYQTPDQRTWQHNAEKHGNRYVVCKSLEEFKYVVQTYLSRSCHR